MTALKSEQRPFLWTVGVAQPTFRGPPEGGGQIFINWQYGNFGRGIAYNVSTVCHIKVGDGGYQLCNGGKAEAEDTGLQMPPGKVDFSTAISRPGLSEDYFNKMLSTERAIGILIDFHYADGTGKEIYTNSVCMERLLSSAMNYRNPKDCH